MFTFRSYSEMFMKFICYLTFSILFIFIKSPYAITIEANNVTYKTSGGPVENGWNLYSNGSIGEYIKVEIAGTYEVVVCASGSPFNNIWPLMALNVDLSPKTIMSVDKENYDHYSFQVKLSEGVHFIGVTFLNDDYKIPGIEDRNLYVKYIEIRPTNTFSEPVISNKENWELEAKLREDSLLKETDELIKINRMGFCKITVYDENDKPLPSVSVTIDQIEHDFLFGCNIYMFDKFDTAQENSIYKEKFRELFNYATVPFYWSSFEYTKGDPNYKEIDNIVEWAKIFNIKLKGHPLLWDSEPGIPPWSDGQPPTIVQKERVTNIIQRYVGKIDVWEVVNEPSHLLGIKINEPHKWARAANSSAYLIINDFEVLANGYPNFYELLKNAKDEGVPYDAVGIQAHEPQDMAFPLNQVYNIIETYANLGKDIHITEFTPQSSGNKVTGSNWRNIWDEDQQADYAEKFYRVCFSHPSVSAISWWDLCDKKAWREGGGMLRSDLSPKPVYNKIKNLIKNEWKTSLQGLTDASGSFNFKGYYGKYKISINNGKNFKESIFYLEKNKIPELKIKIERNLLNAPINLRVFRNN